MFVWASRVLLLLSSALLCAGADISFNRDIRPILAEKCFECHGPAKAKGGLRLDLENSATNRLKSGAIAIAPRTPSDSELLRRIRATDDDQMPPKDSAKNPLTVEQSAIIEHWISAGAKWDRHWAFNPIRRPAVPPAAFPESALNPIDCFVQKELAAHALRPSPPASDRILKRRIAFDLTGLPPSIEHSSPTDTIDAYLASPAFGERMALWWLDLVRYADTEGYFADSHRNIYPYRDYVMDAFNENKPFDQFTIEQLAGDLLPNATWEQKIASGYNRLILTTHEDGANAAEYRARYAADRVRNLGTVWLGMTIGCAQCHDHKFDPLTAADFYRLGAFFADMKEEAVKPQPESFIGLDDPEYRKLIEATNWFLRPESTSLPELQCEQVLMEQEVLMTRRAPSYFPKSKKTDDFVQLVLRKAEGKTSAAEEKEIARYFQGRYLNDVRRRMTPSMVARRSFETNAVPTLITERSAPRTVRILPRGNWMDQSGPQVQAAVPAIFHHEPARPQNRLDLAEWLVSRDNPLTARVIANRLWQIFFGAGIARNLDDFGAQGEAPANPELLDYLASELIDSKWDIKHVVRLIVTSYTYQQASATTPDHREHDPDNRFFARQNRFPISAETVRDNALSAANLLSLNMCGPAVKSYLSIDSLFLVDTLSEEPYITDKGERLHRRGIYLYRKRGLLHPTLAAFNASTREECASQRIKSNSPRQALATLNAPEFVEAARAFAERIYRSGPCDSDRITRAFEFALNREPSQRESQITLNLLESQRKTFAANPTSAAKYIRTGDLLWPADIDAADLAAWTEVARALLNLEEFNTRY